MAKWKIWVALLVLFVSGVLIGSVGTRMYVPGYGWGVIEDRGGAIRGANRLDLYFDSHDNALDWGRKTVEVPIEKKQ